MQEKLQKMLGIKKSLIKLRTKKENYHILDKDQTINNATSQNTFGLKYSQVITRGARS